MKSHGMVATAAAATVWFLTAAAPWLTVWAYQQQQRSTMIHQRAWLKAVISDKDATKIPRFVTAVWSSERISDLDVVGSTSWEEEDLDGEATEEDVVVNDDDNELMEKDDDDDDEEDTFGIARLQEEYHQWTKAIQKAQEGLHKKESSLENERAKAQALEETVARAQLIVNNMYLFNSDTNNNNKVYQVTDWDKDGATVELVLDPQYESAAAEAEALFAQARKMKRGSRVIQELLEQVQQAKQVLVECQADLDAAVSSLVPLDNENSNNFDVDIDMDEKRNNFIQQLRVVQNRLRRTSSTTQFHEPPNVGTSKDNDGSNQSSRRQPRSGEKKSAPLGSPASNVRKLTTPDGATVLVGRNRRGNEYLTFHQARQKDVWMHARGTPGAHVLVLDRRGSVPPTEQCLAFAAHLAAFYSDSRTERQVPVTVAEPRHLLKPFKGAPLGAVKLRQEGRVLYGCPSMVPPELVEAREQSGTSEEYRAADKAKHRKQAQKNQQQQRNKKRQRQRNSNKEDE